MSYAETVKALVKQYIFDYGPCSEEEISTRLKIGRQWIENALLCLEADGELEREIEWRLARQRIQ